MKLDSGWWFGGYDYLKNSLVFMKGGKIYDLPIEFLDVLLMFGGGGKHDPESWRDPDGPTMSHTETHNSSFHHLAQSFSGLRIDEGTKLDHCLSVSWRMLVYYTRLKRGITHSKDKK